MTDATEVQPAPDGRVIVDGARYRPSEIPAQVRRYERLFERAKADSERAAARRRELGPGASRARVTTANARWATAAEHRDRLAAHLNALRAAVGGVHG